MQQGNIATRNLDIVLNLALSRSRPSMTRATVFFLNLFVHRFGIARTNLYMRKTNKQ